MKKHYIPFALAFIVAFISIAPQLYFAFFSPNFSGIHMFGTDAEYHYLARIQEVRDGHVFQGNVFLPDKDKPYLMMGGGEIITAALGKIFFMDTVEFNVLGKFLFPFIIFLLIYAFVYKVFNSKSIAVIAASMAFFGGDLTSGLSFIKELFYFTSSATGFLAYTRPINPQVSAIFLFAGLYILFKLAHDNEKSDIKSIKLPIMLGVVSGLAVYVYVYVWSFLAIITGLYFLYFLYKRNAEYIKKFLYVIFTHALFTIPYWINFFQAKFYQNYAESAARQGLVASHAIMFGMWLAISLIIMLFFWPDEYKKAKKFLLFVTISLWIATNSQVVTGIMVQQAHYHWNITKPVLVSIIVSALFIYFIRRFIKNKKIVTSAVVFAVLVLIYHGILIQINSYQARYGGSVELQRYSPVIEYLKSAYPKPQNVWTISSMSSLPGGTFSAVLPVYTNHNSASVHYAGFYLNPNDYFVNLFFLEYKLRGISPGDAADVIYKERGYISHFVFGIYYRELYGRYVRIPDEVLDEMAESYKEFYKLSYEEIFNDLNIDLAVWDKKLNPDLEFENIPALKQVHNVNDEFIIFSTQPR